MLPGGYYRLEGAIHEESVVASSGIREDNNEMPLILTMQRDVGEGTDHVDDEKPELLR